MSSKAHLQLDNNEDSIRQADICLMIDPKNHDAFKVKEKALI